MKKNEVVKDNTKFNNIIKTGKYIKNSYYVIYYLPKKEEKPNFGIAVGNKIGKAYVRNKYKRRIRSIIDQNKLLFKNNFDYIIIMKKACLEISYSDMENEFKSLLENKVK